MNDYLIWLLLGSVLLAVEILFLNVGYMLILAIAAFVIALLNMFFDDLGLTTNLLIFALLTSVITSIWWAKRPQKEKDNQDNQLNQSGNNMVGKKFIVRQDLQAGYNQTDLAGASWRVYTEANINNGSHVQVMKINGITLTIKQID